MEKALKVKLASHADRLGILSKEQYGFRREHSMAKNLICHHDKVIEALERGDVVDCVYNDMSQAFDRVSHSKLTRRVKGVGYKGNILTFIANF